MSNIRIFLAALILGVMTVVPVWAYNSQPSGVAYNDPQFSTMYVTGAARVGGTLTLGSTAVTASAAELNLLDGFTALGLRSLSVTGGVTIPAGESNVATYSVTGINSSDTILWNRTTAIATAASRSVAIVNIRASATNEVEVTTVNASDSSLISASATVKLLSVR